jgi:hypothetical protein
MLLTHKLRYATCIAALDSLRLVSQTGNQHLDTPVIQFYGCISRVAFLQELARAAAAASSAAALTSGIAAPAAARMAQGLFAHGAGALNPAGALAIHQRLQQAGLSMEEVLAVAASAGAGLAPGIAPAMPTAAGLATGVRAPAVKPALGNAQMVGGAAAGRGGGTAQGLGMQSEVARRLRAQGRLE